MRARRKHVGSLLHLTQRYVLEQCPRPHSTLLAGGVVLWSRSFTPEAAHITSSAASPVNSLIREALIEGRTAEEKYEKDGYAVKWTFVNDLELIFVVRTRPTPAERSILTLRNRSRTSASYNSPMSKISSRP